MGLRLFFSPNFPGAMFITDSRVRRELDYIALALPTCTFQVDFTRKLLPFHFFQDGRVIVFYSAHNGKNMFYRISEKPEDISSWGQG